MIVVDASVAVKWLLPEPGSEAATDLLRNRDMLAAPDLIRVEVASAVTRRVRRGELSAEDAKEIVRLWTDVLKQGVIQIHSNLDDLREGAHLALQMSHNIYDCVYLATARRIGARLVTADRVFVEKATGVYPAIELLGR